MSDAFLREIILPRLDSLENEVVMLRRFTWPVCQLYIERLPLSDPLQQKKDFLKHLYRDEALDLLKRKAHIAKADQVLFDQEVRDILSRTK
jgi:hypothetical protein